MGLMPRVAIETSTATPARKYREPHERANGPWDAYELEDGGRALERAEQVKGNPKYVEAIAKHHEAKAKLHHGLAHKARHMRKSGAISDRALERAADRKHARS
jgi:hypothetical protein